MKERILALLLAKFAGVRKDCLTQLAGVLALQVTTEEEAQAAVDKLTADGVSQFVTDLRKDVDAEITKANKTYEDGLRRKYDFKEKEGEGNADPTNKQDGQQQPQGGVTLEAIAALIDAKIKPLQQERTASSRRDQIVAKLDAAKIEGRQRDMMLRSFDRAASTFKDDEDFNGYLSELDGDIEAFQQEKNDDDLSKQEKPIFGAVNKDGVSSGVADYIAAQSEQKASLSGKEV